MNRDSEKERNDVNGEQVTKKRLKADEIEALGKLLDVPGTETGWSTIAWFLHRIPTRIIKALCYRVTAARKEAYDDAVGDADPY